MANKKEIRDLVLQNEKGRKEIEEKMIDKVRDFLEISSYVRAKCEFPEEKRRILERVNCEMEEFLSIWSDGDLIWNDEIALDEEKRDGG